MTARFNLERDLRSLDATLKRFGWAHRKIECGVDTNPPDKVFDPSGVTWYCHVEVATLSQDEDRVLSFFGASAKEAVTKMLKAIQTNTWDREARS